MSLLDLPTELHDQIAGYLPTSGLRSLATTAKAFSQVAQERLCRHIYVELTGIPYGDCLRKLIVVLLVRNDLATSIRTTTITGLSIAMIRNCKERFRMLKDLSLVQDLEIAITTLLLLSPRLYALDIPSHWNLPYKFWTTLHDNKVLHRLEALERLALPYQAANSGRDLAYSIPQKLQHLCFHSVNHGLLFWLKALPASLHQFPILQSLTLNISVLFPGNRTVRRTWQFVGPQDCKDRVKDFVEAFRGANIWLVILFKDQEFDTATIPNMECIKIT